MRVAAALPLVLALLLVPGPQTAFAADVSSAEFSDLIARAPRDPDALERLRAVDSVDERPIDIDAVLEGASRVQIERRLAAFRPGGTSPVDADAARADASNILSQRRYRGAATPRPLKGVLDRLGDALEGIVDRLGRSALALPGGLVTLWALLVVAVAVVASLVALRLVGRPTGLAARQRTTPGERHAHPAHLEGQAEIAERQGDLSASLRLRFKAGLLRLAGGGLLPPAASLTSEEISASLRSPTFDRLAATFDRVVYGRRPATERDVEEAREGWSILIKERRR